jgi:hypothetical protein
MKLYKSKEIRDNEVEVLFWNFITDTYHEDADNYTVRNDGYVRNSNGTQVCEMLRATGNTLKWNGEGKFINFIRKELRKWSLNVRK